MTPEDIARDRPVRTLCATAPAEILFDRGGDIAVRMSNARGNFEVLATADRARDFLAATSEAADLELTGFWRRRSGIRATGERRFIWTLVLLSWSVENSRPLAA